jgi:hypothetical protein
MLPVPDPPDVERFAVDPTLNGVETVVAIGVWDCKAAAAGVIILE